LKHTISDKDSILRLIRDGTPLLDVRAEIEFEKGSIQNSSNIPILSNDERKKVGTCYKEKGQDAAILLGQKLTKGSKKEERIQKWKSFFTQNPNAALFCARGGLRSKITQQWLSDADLEVSRVDGGYKKIRGLLLEVLDSVDTRNFVTIAGLTGSGKTSLLHSLKKSGYLVLDLEAIANHRGSAFGQLKDPQPSQAAFENNLASALIRLKENENFPIFVEKESIIIGRCWLGKKLISKINESPTIHLNCTLDERINNIIEDYIKKPLNNGDVSNAEIESLKDSYIASLKKITKKLGFERANIVERKIKSAFELYKIDKSLCAHFDWVQDLLIGYYDPSYLHKPQKARNSIIFTGNLDEVVKFIHNRFNSKSNNIPK